MLNETGVNWSNARILFCHINPLFVRSLFESEHKRRFFSEIESVPTIDVYTTQDNTKSKVLVQEAKQAIEKSDSSPHYR